MNTKYLVLSLWIIGFIATLVYYDYLVWFKPSKYKSDSVRNVRDWWPFASFFRHWFASEIFIWIIRFVYSSLTLAILIIVIIMVATIIGLT